MASATRSLDSILAARKAQVTQARTQHLISLPRNGDDYDSDDDEEVVVGQRSRQRSRRGEQNAQIEIATPESISSPAAAAAPEKQSTSEHTQGVPSAGVQHKEPDKDKDKASLAAKVGLIKNEFRIDQKMPMHQAMSVAEAELGFQACNEQSMLQRVEQVLKAAGL